MATLAPDPSTPSELFAPPSAEHVRLVRYLPWLVSPRPDNDGPIARFLRMVMVAPMTQCTFLSFDLQVFLYGVFHTTLTARIGHFVFQALVTLWLMVAATALPAGHLVLGGVLLAWYAAMARQDRLWLWPVVMVPCVGGLVLAAQWIAQQPWAVHPLLWAIACAFIVALSHAPEPYLPPRTVEGNRWLTVKDYILGSGHLPSPRWLRALRVGLFPIWGTLDELWASPRLVPYGVLLLMFAAGYRRDVADRHAQWLQRALQSGNPSLDFVGICGAAYLRPLAMAIALGLAASSLVVNTATAAIASDIHVSAKEVPGTSIPQWTVHAVIAAPPEAVWKVVDDCTNYKRSMPRVAVSKELSRVGNRTQCETTVHMPFPLSDLHGVSEAHSEVAAGSWRRTFKHLRGDYEVSDGSWLLKPLPGDPQRTQVVYVLHSIPKTNLPARLMRKGQADAMADLMHSVAKVAGELARAPGPVPRAGGPSGRDI